MVGPADQAVNAAKDAALHSSESAWADPLGPLQQLRDACTHHSGPLSDATWMALNPILHNCPPETRGRLCQVLTCTIEDSPARRQQALARPTLLTALAALVQEGTRGHPAGPHAAQVIRSLFDPSDPGDDAAAATAILTAAPGASRSLTALLLKLSRRGRGRLRLCVPCVGALLYLVAPEVSRGAALVLLGQPGIAEALRRVAGSPLTSPPAFGD
ncbi:hypothetical protein MNEG_10074 [Monoraphidium neglectum]|uniref:Uncharacterized protein n=1 Tax=Monoraphidium neglectum TaxID=145388 RepID=A0A0D2M2L6_9CHLO|nr:hypothetical protein MNEG_10074 [Monoraphidium neglectum]KIY97889.1 hypothetical protein MNEG_10074 [Monoraphidium neglectum]|eukprot:XP_013896909.1 hypothetical protein MNEG_10074 [Monoraphidium neglectum]